MAPNNDPGLFQVPSPSSAPEETQISIFPAFSETPFEVSSFKWPLAAPSKPGGHRLTKQLLNNQTKNICPQRRHMGKNKQKFTFVKVIIRIY